MSFPNDNFKWKDFYSLYFNSLFYFFQLEISLSKFVVLAIYLWFFQNSILVFLIKKIV